MTKIFLAIPVLREIHPMVLESILHSANQYMTHAHIEAGYVLPIDEKRNECVRKFLETDCTHLLFWDSDTVSVPGAIEKLLADDKDIVGATIYKKGGDHVPCFGFWVPEQRIYRTPLPFPYNQLIPVDMVGTGFMLIKRKVLEKVPPPWFKCYDKGNAQEDIYFCLKAKKEYGFEVYVDTGLSLGHIATPYLVTNETFEMSTFWNVIKRFRAEGRLDKFREILVKEMNLTPEELQQQGIPEFRIKLSRDVVGYKPPEDLKKAYLQYIDTVSNQVWAVSWELTVYLDKLLKSMKAKRILDLGSGFSSFLFRLTGADVTSVETDPDWMEKTRKFLEEHKVSTDKLMLQKELELEGTYDLCLMDLGKAETNRVPLLEEVRKHCKVIILDDMHVDGYREEVRKIFTDDVVFDLSIDTKDAYNRYAWMVVIQS